MASAPLPPPELRKTTSPEQYDERAANLLVPLYCPWCGKVAEINTTSPITVDCTRCEATTSIKSIT